MATQEKLLVVVDPTASQHPGIARTVNIVEHLKDAPPQVVVMVAVDYSGIDTAATNDRLYCDDQWLKELVAPLTALNVDMSVRISWSLDWADAILYSVEKTGVTSILLPHPGKESKRKLSNEFWYLMRNSPVPLLLVHSTQAPKGRPIIAAMDLRDEKLTGLNERILSMGKRAAQANNSELHLAHIYQESTEYPDRNKLVKSTGLPNDNIHVRMGDLSEKISQLISELGAGMVISGATRRTGLRAALQGRKITAILQNIDHDLMMVV